MHYMYCTIYLIIIYLWVAVLHANNCFIVLLDFDNFINSLFCNYFNYFDLVMRASSLFAFRCYFELPSINKDFTSL